MRFEIWGGGGSWITKTSGVTDEEKGRERKEEELIVKMLSLLGPPGLRNRVGYNY